ncbi:basic helix-loop-helix domain-containing protein [Aspergillus lucknowensis]|uniref:BHLH domain-containing protein n=1 Tax=Aspergillus lucknowensis TaxID=176173 RepID=A0ABR4M225_9EURO
MEGPHHENQPFPDPGYFHLSYQNRCESVSSSDTRILQPEPKRPRHARYSPSNYGDYTYLRTPEPAVPSHQILPSQRDTRTPGTTSPPSPGNGPESPSQALFWGSDPSFGPDGYSPHPDTPTHDLMGDNLSELYLSWVNLTVEEPSTAGQHGRGTLVELEGGKRKNRKDGDGPQPSSRRRLQHILSERNRRTQQSKLYDEICSLVPGVSLKRCRKSEVLARAAGWLEALMEGNKSLMEQLEYLRGFESGKERS